MYPNDLVTSRPSLIRRLTLVAILCLVLVALLYGLGVLTADSHALKLRFGSHGIYTWPWRLDVLPILGALLWLAWVGTSPRSRPISLPAVAALLTVHGLLALLMPLPFILVVTAAAALLAWLLDRAFTQRFSRLSSHLAFRAREGGKWLAVGGLLAALGVLLLLGRWLHAGIPYVVDSSAELFHARILQQGRFALTPPPLPEFFWLGNIYCGPGGWYSQYVPGHMLWLAITDLVGYAWGVNSLFGVGTLLLTWSLATRLYGLLVGNIATVLLFVSPFFLQMQSGFMSHGSAIFLLTFALWRLESIDRSRRPLIAAAMLGIALGYATITRPLTGVGFLIPLVIWGAWRKLPRLDRPVVALLCSFLAASIPMIWLLIFNFGTYGDPFTNAYKVVNPDYTQYGFSAALPLLKGLSHTLNNLYLLSLYLHGLPTGSFLLIAILLVAGRPRESDWLLLALCGSLSLAYMPYHYQDHWYGPRFLYEALPMLCILSARGVEVILAWSRQLRRGPAIIGTALALWIGCSAVSTARQVLRPIARASVAGQRPIMEAAEAVRHDPKALVFIGGLYAYTVAPLNAGWETGALYALDLGEEQNRRLIEAMPDRVPWRIDPATPDRLLPYPQVDRESPPLLP
jgi:hypothetical protein